MRFSSFSVARVAAAALASASLASRATAQSKGTPAPVLGSPREVTAFVGVSVVPMDRERVIPNCTVLIKGGRIAAIGPANTIQIPKGAKTIDGHGKFLIPGLADMHAHVRTTTHLGNVPKPFAGAGGQIVPLPVESISSDTAIVGSPEDRLFFWLANGVTTVRLLDYFEDPALDPSMDKNETWEKESLRLRALADSGQIWSPRIYTAGQWGPRKYIGLTKLSKDPAVQADTVLALDSIAGFIARYKARGFDVLKIHEEKLEVIDSVMAAAKRVGMPVVGHVPNGTVEHVLPGYKSIEHPVTDYPWNEAAGLGALASAMHKYDVYNTPTQWHYNHLHYSVWSPQKVLNLKVLQDSGVKLLVGTDELPRTGLVTREMQEFVAGGLTPFQALECATVNVARYFGTSKETGTIEKGKRADLVLIDGNPLQDIRYTAQPAGVMIGGRWLSRQDIDRLAKGKVLMQFTAGQGADRIPLKSYWSNVNDEFVDTAIPVFGYDFFWAGVQEVGNRYSDSTLPVGLRQLRQEVNEQFGAGMQTLTMQPQFQAARTKFTAQRQALVDSLGTSEQYAEGTMRIVKLIAQQLGEFRPLLSQEYVAPFDQRVRDWVKQRAAQGYAVTVTGVSP